jgi:outer membrane protein assembly factor BamD (BamD/ComL family)
MAADHRQDDARRRFAAALQALLALGLALAVPPLAAGCHSGPFAAWRDAADDSLSKAPTAEETGDDRFFLARWLNPSKAVASYDPEKRMPLLKGPNGMEPPKEVKNPEADAELKAALALLEQKNYPEAEKALAAIAKKRAKSSWGERAQFYLAEAYYQEGKLVYAHDEYDRLFTNHPGSVFIEKAVAREFAIAQAWLALAESQTKPEESPPWYGRFDGRRPVMDTWGYAKMAFDHVRHHDPTGPLYDDATMILADMHMKIADYELAALYYNQLITECPKSPFLERAHLAEIDAHIKGYIGPEYDGTGLEKARERVRQTMTAFPDRAANDQQLYHVLDLLRDQDAERTYKVGEFYRRTGRVASAEYYFGKVPQKWPSSPWAVKAKTELASLAKMPREPSLPSRILTSPGLTDPFSANSMMGGGPMQMGNMGMGMGGPGMGMPMGGMGMM